MPELPEVESARAFIEATALGRRIAAADDRDTYVCRPHAPGELDDALRDRTLGSLRAGVRGRRSPRAARQAAPGARGPRSQPVGARP